MWNLFMKYLNKMNSDIYFITFTTMIHPAAIAASIAIMQKANAKW